MPYTKLDTGIIFSTVWREPHTTFRVWITLLAIKNRSGEVHASIPGLADTARVSLEECEIALATFHAPDKYSRTQELEGRRIETIDGGWLVLNHDKYRGLEDPDDRRKKAAIRAKRYRDRHAVTRDETSGNAPSREHHDKQMQMQIQKPEAGTVLGKVKRVKKDPVKASNSASKADASKKRTWLSPIADVWQVRFGKDTFPFKQHAKPLAELYNRGEPMDEVARRLGNYLDSLSGPQFINVPNFVHTYGAWEKKNGKQDKHAEDKDALRSWAEK